MIAAPVRPFVTDLSAVLISCRWKGQPVGRSLQYGALRLDIVFGKCAKIPRGKVISRYFKFLISCLFSSPGACFMHHQLQHSMTCQWPHITTSGAHDLSGKSSRIGQASVHQCLAKWLFYLYHIYIYHIYIHISYIYIHIIYIYIYMYICIIYIYMYNIYIYIHA